MQRHRWQRQNVNDPPTGPGVYAFSSRGRVLYVGSALDIRSRLQSYGIATRWRRSVCKFGEIRHLELRTASCRRPEDRLSREARLIARVRPPFNVTGQGDGARLSQRPADAREASHAPYYHRSKPRRRRRA